MMGELHIPLLTQDIPNILFDLFVCSAIVLVNPTSSDYLQSPASSLWVDCICQAAS